MCGKRDEGLLLDDMIEAASRAVSYADGVPPGCLGDDTEKSDAILFNLTVLGEAAKTVSDEMRSRDPEIPWAEMAMMRDKIVHHYHGIDWATVTDVVTAKLPWLLPRLRALRAGLRTD